MPKRAKELSALEVKRLDRKGLHSVGGVAGLKLQVTKTGARSWILRATVGSKIRSIGLGAYPDVTLSQARDKARDMREQIADGIDPVEQRREARRALIAAQAKEMSFAEAARQKHQAILPTLTNKQVQDSWIRALEIHAFPVIGHMPVDRIELAHVLKVLQPIWQTKIETAGRVRRRMEATLSWATVGGYREGPNPAEWKGNLSEVLPAQGKIRKVKHQPALPWSEVPEFLQQLKQRGGMAARALELVILTASRSGEVRKAMWSEIDLSGKVWLIPAERMKMKRDHRVPLSDEAVALLKGLPRQAGTDLVFPNNKNRPLSDPMLSRITKSMGGECVPHGFRSSFKDWARHNSSMPDEVSELALAHVDKNSVRDAYARDDLLPQRAKMMQAWGTFLREPVSRADVVGIGEANRV